MSQETGYYGYTEGELVIVSGVDGTVGVQLRQGFAKEPRPYRRTPEGLAALGANERKKPCKEALAQAMRFEFDVPTSTIAKLLSMTAPNVCRATIGDYSKGIPWEVRRYRSEAIAEAKLLLDASGYVVVETKCRGCNQTVSPQAKWCSFHRRVRNAEILREWRERRKRWAK